MPVSLLWKQKDYYLQLLLRSANLPEYVSLGLPPLCMISSLRLTEHAEDSTRAFFAD
jgi:hypothetical protein